MRRGYFVIAAAFIGTAACSGLIGLGDSPPFLLSPTPGDAGDAEVGDVMVGDRVAADVPDATSDIAVADSLQDGAPAPVGDEEEFDSGATEVETGAPPASCSDVLARQLDAGSGIYAIVVDGVPLSAYCDMSLAGGGWTLFFADLGGKTYADLNGGMNFLSATTNAPIDDCPDPAAKCLRHLPTSVGVSNEFAATCGDAAIRFGIMDGLLGYLHSGVPAGWQPLETVTAIAGDADTSTAIDFWTGTAPVDQSMNYGWIIGNPAIYASTFASSYNNNNIFDSCNGVPLASTPPMVTLLYR